MNRDQDIIMNRDEYGVNSDDTMTPSTYRVTGIRPWADEGNAVPAGVQTFFEGKEVTMDDLRALAASFGAELDSAVQGGGRQQATIRWQGHRYDLDLERLP